MTDNPELSRPSLYDAEERLAAGDAYVSTWWSEAEPISLERAVVEYRAALAQCSLDNPDCRIRVQISLSDALRLQFEDGLGGEEDEEELFQEALDLAESAVKGTAPPSTLHLEALRALGQVLFRRFHTKVHLKQATDIFRGLVDSLSDSQRDLLITALTVYSIALSSQFDNESRESVLLKLANEAVERALALLREGEHAPYDLIHAQSLVLAEQGCLSRDPTAIDEPIAIMLGMLDIIPRTHPRVPYYWCLLGVIYERRYRLSGSAEDLDNQLMACDQARKRTPRSHPIWPSNEGNYAVTLYFRFLARGDLRDQEEAIEVAREGVRHVLSAPAKGSYLGDVWVGNLAECLRGRYLQTGELSLLDEAIGLHWDNFGRVPRSRRGRALHSISTAYRARFLAQGRFADLQRSYSTLGQALECPLERKDHAECVYALADVLLAMYNEVQDISTLHKAISLLQKSLASDLPQPHTRAEHQSLLGLALLTRGGIASSASDIEDSIQCQNDALELLLQEDTRQCVCYFRLGLAEYQSFVIGLKRIGLNNSIVAFNRALSIMAMDHPDRASYLSHLVKSLFALSDLNGSATTFTEALNTLREAARHSASWLVDRYEASIQWARAAHQSGYRNEAIEAYRLAISLLPELASVRLEDELRVQHIGKQAREIPQDAAACALELGQPDLAVELLEAGRTLLWNARQELRADLARLEEVSADLAKELAQTNAALDSRPQDDATTMSITERESERRRLHRLASRRTELVNQIRLYPGFEEFLSPPTFSSLRQAAAHGPIIVLNASTYRCDAIVIQAEKEITIIPLTTLNSDQIKNEARTLQYWLSVASRDSKGLRFLEVVLHRLLDWLWKSVGRPVCFALKEYLATPGLHRVWWCPTGALSFLPIHACGPSDGTQLGMPDVVISSYTPTISALLRAQKEKPIVEAASSSLLVVTQPNAPGYAPLLGANDEMKVLEALFPDSGTFLVGPEATLSTVEASLRDNGWFHVISHGTQNSRNPLESAVALYDGPLKLSRLAQANLPHAEFAFLSACHSAKGTAWVPDESMHLAAGMVFAGFRAVVATSWGIADKDAPAITREFYRHLLRKRSPPLATDAAEALHVAVQRLRQSGVPAQRWVPFIHLGA